MNRQSGRFDFPRLSSQQKVVFYNTAARAKPLPDLQKLIAFDARCSTIRHRLEQTPELKNDLSAAI
jgi:hypothetical protein